MKKEVGKDEREEEEEGGKGEMEEEEEVEKGEMEEEEEVEKGERKKMKEKPTVHVLNVQGRMVEEKSEMGKTQDYEEKDKRMVAHQKV